jgi:hypothetical protein
MNNINFLQQSEMQHCFICHGEHRRGTTYICYPRTSNLSCNKCQKIGEGLLNNKKCNYCPNCGHKL